MSGGRTGRIAIVAALGGLATALGPAAPTGNTAIDAVLVGGGTALLVAVGAFAPWWLVAGAAGVAMAIAGSPLLIAVATVALLAATWVGATRTDRPDVLAASLAVAFAVLARARLDGPLGTPTAVTAVVVVALFVAGIRTRPRSVRRIAWSAVAVVVVGAGTAAAGFGYEAARARHDLGAGSSKAELGVAALERGDFDEARRWFQESSVHLRRAHERLSGPLALPAAAVPIVAQNRAAVVDMATAGASGAATVTDALGEIHPERLRAVDSRIDLDALAALQVPLTRVRDALADLQAATNRSRSPWLVARATTELDDFAESIDEHLPSLDEALTAIDLGPRFLGADGERTYLVLFTTPSESRGLGGFIGSYAELTIADGQLSMGVVERAQDLDAAAQQAGATVRGHAEFLRQYGRFGFDADGNGRVGDAAFRNLAMTPNFPSVGAIAADLYRQTTGHEVDGVIALDPSVMAALLNYTGPVALPSLGAQIDAGTATSYLLRDQYVLADGDQMARADALGEAASSTFDALMAGALPDPVTLAGDLGPLVSERRLLLWSADAEEQQLLERVHAAGAIPALDGADGWAFTVTNGAGNKIDSYLQRRSAYHSSTDPATGVTDGTLHIELTNNAPAQGAPRYVIGNTLQLPPGTSRLYLSTYTPLGLAAIRVDGRDIGVSAGEESGWQVYSTYVDIPAGATVNIEVRLRGHVADPARLVTWTQPMADELSAL